MRIKSLKVFSFFSLLLLYISILFFSDLFAQKNYKDNVESLQDEKISTWKLMKFSKKKQLAKFFVYQLMLKNVVAMQPEELENYQSKFLECLDAVIPRKLKKYKYWGSRPIKEVVPACKQKVWGYTNDNHHFWQ